MVGGRQSGRRAAGGGRQSGRRAAGGRVVGGRRAADSTVGGGWSAEFDLYARVHHRYHEMEWDCHQRLREYVMLILEHFDTSCYDSIYTGDVEGIKILLKLDLDDLMELSLSSGAVIPITNPEPFTEDERRRIETINKHNTEPVNYTPVVVLGTGINDAFE
jgi:hypothetical protein